MPENKILVIRGGAIGDFILTLPVLSALRAQFPRTRLEVLGYPHIARLALSGELAEAHPGTDPSGLPLPRSERGRGSGRGGAPAHRDQLSEPGPPLPGPLLPPREEREIIVHDPGAEAGAARLADAVRPIESRALAGFFARDGELDEALQSYFGSFAIIISFLYDPDRIFLSNVARCSRAQFIVGPHRPDDNAGLHATEVFLKPLQQLAIFDSDPVPRLPLNSQLPTLNQLALHPGSGSERKNWPEANWAELLELLAAETSLQFLLVGGEAEGDRLTRLAQVLPPNRCEILSSQPLDEVARRLSQCASFVGHDSGITHLAAALGVPTLALWGPTPEAVWAPRGERVTILRALPVSGYMAPAEVLTQLRRFLQELG